VQAAEETLGADEAAVFEGAASIEAVFQEAAVLAAVAAEGAMLVVIQAVSKRFLLRCSL